MVPLQGHFSLSLPRGETVLPHLEIPGRTRLWVPRTSVIGFFLRPLLDEPQDRELVRRHPPLEDEVCTELQVVVEHENQDREVE